MLTRPFCPPRGAGRTQARPMLSPPSQWNVNLVAALVAARVDDAFGSLEAIEDLAEHLSTLVLHRRHAEVVADHPEQPPQQLGVVAGHATKPEESPAVPQLVRHARERVADGVGDDVASVDLDPAMRIRRQHRSRLGQRLDTSGIERGQPIGLTGEVGRAPRPALPATGSLNGSLMWVLRQCSYRCRPSTARAAAASSTCRSPRAAARRRRRSIAAA